MASHVSLTEGDITEALKKRYKSPEYAFLPQIRNQTGFGRVTRTADGVAMSLWPSRGLTLTGFEIKCYRGDWLSELKNPEKAEEIMQYCDFWYVVCPAPVNGHSVIQEGEVPATWGLMNVYESGTLKVIKTAPQLEAKEVSKKFLAAILRGVDGYCAPLAAVDKARERGVREGIESERKKSERESESYRIQIADLNRDIREFEKASGVSLRWQAGRMGKAVGLFLDGGARKAMEKQLFDLQHTARCINMQIEESLKHLKEANENNQAFDRVPEHERRSSQDDRDGGEGVLEV
jgi:hypothetical protein